MRFNTATTLRCIFSVTAFFLPLSLLTLAACGSGGGGGGGGGIAGGPLVSTFSGTANPGADGIGAAARFNGPANAVSDGINLYVADSANNIIRKIEISTGAVSTLAGKAGVAGAADDLGTAATFNTPTGIAIDSTNTNLYVVDSGNNKIRQVVISTAAVSSLTGTANTAMTAGAADGTAATAAFNNPRGMTADGVTLYVADTGNQKIRRVDISTGTTSSLTGTANTQSGAGALDGSNFSATFNNPTGIVIDSSKTLLYVADTNNNKIRRVLISNGAVSSFTGPLNTAVVAGDVEGTGTSASFNLPRGIAADASNLYVADTGNNKIRQIVINTVTVSSLTGASGVPSAAGFTDGATSSATFAAPGGLTALAGFGGTSSNLFVADTGNNTIRNIGISSAQVSTLAGIPLANSGANGAGAAARYNLPGGVVSDGTYLYVADSANNTIRRITIATAVATTLAGQSGVAGAADNAVGTSATFNNPAGITTDGTNLYVADTNNNKIRKVVIATGAVSSLTGAANTAVTAGAADGAGTTAAFSAPTGITTDGTNLYVADTGNNKIRQVVIAGGAVSSITGASGVAVTAGAADGAAAGATLSAPFGITLIGANLYVADTGNNKIRLVAIGGGAVSSFTGAANTAITAGAADGAAASASFSQPRGIATDGASLYVADAGNNKIRKVAVATGAVSSLTGAANSASTAGYADGVVSAATFSGPYAITTVGSSQYVADTGNSTIRRIQ